MSVNRADCYIDIWTLVTVNGCCAATKGLRAPCVCTVCVLFRRDRNTGQTMNKVLLTEILMIEGCEVDYCSQDNNVQMYLTWKMKTVRSCGNCHEA